MTLLKNMLQERRMMPRKENRDFFDYVLEELSKEGTVLTEGIALDLMFVLLFASFETTSLALTLAVKYLTDYPLVLQTLMVIISSFIHLITCLSQNILRFLQFTHFWNDRRSTKQSWEGVKIWIPGLHGKNTNQWHSLSRSLLWECFHNKELDLESFWNKLKLTKCKCSTVHQWDT